GRPARYAGRPMRVLVATSMYPTPARPELGSFVRDQVESLRAIGGVEVEVFPIEPDGPGRWLSAARVLARLVALPAPVSATLARTAGAGLPGAGERRRVAVLPCGV